MTAPRGTTSTEVVAKKGTRLLCFVVVARTTASAEEAVALCRAHDIGGERGYGVLRDVRLYPARRRGGEPRVEWSATLPAHSTLTVWIQFEKRLLHIDEQPSDASRGVDVPAAALRYRPAGASAAEVRELYAEGGVMPIPLADRSMPYNVVMLTSTVVALFVGSMHNLLARPPALQVTAAGPPA